MGQYYPLSSGLSDLWDPTRGMGRCRHSVQLQFMDSLRVRPLENPVTAWGMPPINMFDLGKCWNISSICPYTDIISVLPPQPPAYLPWSTPMYANANFMLLGQVLSDLTGRDMWSIYQDTLFDPPSLKSIFSSPPKDHADLARSVIVGSPEAGFATDIPVTIPAGSLFSTIMT